MDPAQLQPISARRVSDLSHFAGKCSIQLHVTLIVLSRDCMLVMEMTRTYEQEQAQLQVSAAAQLCLS
jgi:hypothetical protein